MRTVRSKGRWPRLAGGTLALYGAVLAVNRSLVEVQGPSMQPALWEGDRLLTVPARRGWLEPGQVVVVADPHDPDHLVVKRLTAIGAGRVEVHGDHPAASTDSRTWGPLPLAAVRRIAVARWPDLRSPLRRPA
jgi:nickel-type superoxide dismutase maturation protease